MKTYYKVLHRTKRGTLYSCFASNKPWRLKYPIGEWVGTSTGKIFIFDTKLNAREFMCSHGLGETIFLCQAKKVTRPPTNFPNRGYPAWQELWWLLGEKRLRETLSSLDFGLPEGTFWADSIKLTKQVHLVGRF